MPQKLDAIDLRIIRTLQEDARITNLQLSQEIGLSPGPTLERVRKLEQSKFIKSYHAVVNEEALGIGIKAFIHVSLTRQRENAINNFIKCINEIEAVVDCYQVTGNYDYHLLVMVKDIAALNTLISDKLSKVEEIRKMQSYIILCTIKSSKVAPARYE